MLGYINVNILKTNQLDAWQEQGGNEGTWRAHEALISYKNR
jgi:hypothetical protein